MSEQSLVCTTPSAPLDVAVAMILTVKGRIAGADQSHFNRDFRHFTGLTPEGYLNERRKGYGPLRPGRDVSFVPDVD